MLDLVKELCRNNVIMLSDYFLSLLVNMSLKQMEK